MANPTTNYGFILPTPTDLVTDLPADFEVALQGVDTQMKTNADAAIAKTIVDAKGDIIAATAADTVSRLAVGANDTVLVADSTTATGLKWAVPAAGGMTLLSTSTLSGATFTISSIDQTYTDLQVIIRNPRSTNSQPMQINPNSTSGSVFMWGGRGSSVSFAQDIRSENMQTTSNVLNTMVLRINNYANSTNGKGVQFYGSIQQNSDGTSSYGGNISIQSAITSLQFESYLAGSFTGGTVLIYGVK
jgi:hypothetical protein